jgi:hypothetical protein
MLIYRLLISAGTRTNRSGSTLGLTDSISKRGPTEKEKTGSFEYKWITMG